MSSLGIMSPSGPTTRNALSYAQKCHLPPNHGGSQALTLSLLSLVTFNSKQETFGPTKLPRLNCEIVMEEKAQEKSSLLENGTVHQRDVSCGSSGSKWQSARVGRVTLLAFQNSTPAKDTFDHSTLVQAQ